MVGCWFKLKHVPEGEGEDPGAPEGKPYERRKRRCTNEAVRATRPSQLNSRSRLAAAQCFLQHLGRTLAEPFPALVRVRLPALHGHALHGRMVRDECELTCIAHLPFPALVRIGVGHGPSRKLIPAHVNQYVAGIRSPATAGPRRTCAPRASPTVGHGWWYRLGCRVPTYMFEVWEVEPPDAEITEQVISQGKGDEAVFLVNGLPLN